jgi:hypothetical protein
MILMVLMTPSPANAVPQDRTFPNLSLEFVEAVQIPQPERDKMAELSVGNLSAIAYDRQRDRFYALSRTSPARLYTLALHLPAQESAGIPSAETERVTLLSSSDRSSQPEVSFAPEAIALSPKQSVFVSGRQVLPDTTLPFLCEYDLETGNQKRCLDLPKRYLPNADTSAPELMPLGFASLTLVPGGGGGASIDPFPLFTATEFALPQDLPSESPPEFNLSAAPVKSRWLQYLFNVGDRPFQIAEYAYPLDALPNRGLEAILALGQSGQFLSLERSHTPATNLARLYQVSFSGAMDTSRVDSLLNNRVVKPLKKKLLFDLGRLNLPLGNLSGMTLGSYLPNGDQSLILVGDDRLLIFSLSGKMFR